MLAKIQAWSVIATAMCAITGIAWLIGAMSLILCRRVLVLLAVCRPGYERSDDTCVICDPGKYSPGGNSTTAICTACPGGFTTAAAGAASNTSCTGKYDMNGARMPVR